MTNKNHFRLLCVLIFAALLISIPTNGHAAGTLRYLKLDGTWDGGSYANHIAVLDLESGTVEDIPAISDQIEHDGKLFLAPNRSTVAYMKTDGQDKNGEDTATLYVAPIDRFGRVGKSKVVRNRLPTPFYCVLGGCDGKTISAWSPDSKWLIYHWQDQTGSEHLEVSTQDGHEHFVQPFKFTKLGFAGWSDDGAYMAANVNGRLAFLTFPAATITFAPALGAKWYYFGWSATKHLFAYGQTVDATHARLFTINPDHPIPKKLIDFPGNFDWGTVDWSPDDQHIALVLARFDDQEQGAEQIEMVAMDGSHYEVTDYGYHFPGGDVGYAYYPQHYWCDSNTFFYLEDRASLALIGLDVQNRRQTTVLDDGTSDLEAYGEALDHYPTTLLPFLRSEDCQHPLGHWSDNSQDHTGILDLATGKKLPLLDQRTNVLDWKADNWAVAQGDRIIAWAKSDGSSKHQIDVGGSLTPLDWSTDGNWMLYDTDESGKDAVILVYLNTGDQQMIWIPEKQDQIAKFAPDGRSAIIANGSQAVILTIATKKIISFDNAGIAGKIVWSPDSRYFTLSDQSSLDVYLRDGTRLKHFDDVPGFETITWFDQ